MDVDVHPNALKHLTLEQVMQAWDSITKCIRRVSDDEPPRWLCVGWLPNGESVELIAVETVDGWLIIHALSPVQPKFVKEIEQTERRTR